MRVFVTGATGFVGSAVVQDLMAAGHDVTGLARSEASAKALAAVGAKVHRGDVENIESLRQGAAAADGVIHTGFIHDFSRFKEVCETDRRAIEAMGSVLIGTQKPLIISSGTAVVKPGSVATEADLPPSDANAHPRVASEEAARSLAERGVRAAAVRLSPTVHGEGDHGFMPLLITLAREKGLSAYVDEGANAWTAVHRLDVARLFRLALEKGAPEPRMHAVAEDHIPFRRIAEMIGRKLNLPVVSKSGAQAAEHFGWFAGFAGLNCPASSKRTQQVFGWQPTHIDLLTDLEAGHYFDAKPGSLKV